MINVHDTSGEQNKTMYSRTVDTEVRVILSTA